MTIMAKPNGRKLFVNLPVRDLPRSKAFFETLGFSFEPKYSDEKAACLIISEEAFVMLLADEFFKTFTEREICDPSKQVEGLFAITAESKEEVDSLVAKAVDAGGARAKGEMDNEFMYYKSFYDLDGHHWEVLSGGPE
jgi:uncharacterized protein